MQSKQIAQIVDGMMHGDEVSVKKISIDTRTLELGDVYIAINGEFKDGHDYIPQAIEAGASCVISDRDLNIPVPYIKVADTLAAFQALAAAHRQQIHVKTIAVTGSCGKTTTRALLESVFAQAGNTHASKGSLNNHLGVPITLLELTTEHKYFVAEVGANHKGEIASLIPLIQPDVAIITNVGPAHLEGFGSLANIAEAKSEIYEGLNDDGIAIVNADDEFAHLWLHLNKQHKVISFGIKHDADVMADDIHIDEGGYATFTLVLPQSVIEVKLPLIGEHNVYNALSAAAAGYALGLTAQQIKQGLEQAQSVTRRLIEKQTPAGMTVIDDSYNANPVSTEAAIKLLVHRSKQPVFVFGDMKEMGADEADIHSKIGEKAKALGVSKLYCYGELAKQTAQAFGDGAFHFENKDALIEELKHNLSAKETVLVKGSNSMKMNEVVEALVGK
jgi:UDP-N-acetylmuramoyl-tripeptide--D-alanyl-D-alanine ligase